MKLGKTRYSPGGEIVFAKYENGRIAMVSMGVMGPELKITSNLEDFSLGEDELLVKSYSENEGVFEALLATGLVRFVKFIPSGYAKLHLCKLTEEGKKEKERQENENPSRKNPSNNKTP